MADALLFGLTVLTLVVVVVMQWRFWGHVREFRRERIDAGDPGPLDRLPPAARLLVFASIGLVALLWVQLGELLG